MKSVEYSVVDGRNSVTENVCVVSVVVSVVVSAVLSGSVLSVVGIVVVDFSSSQSTVDDIVPRLAV